MIPCCKGQSFISVLSYIESKLPAGAREKIFHNFAEKDREILENPIIPSAFLPEALFQSLLSTIDKLYGAGDYKLCRDIGYFAGGDGIATIFTFFIQFGNPLYSVKFSPVFFKQLHNHGKMESFCPDEHSAVVRIYDFKKYHKSFCNYLRGYFTVALELSGCKKVVVEEFSCATTGSPCCEFHGSWE